MFGLKEISLDFLTGSPVLVWLSLLVFIALAVFLYLKTNPPLPRYLRIILSGLRILALLALFAALLEPVFSFSREIKQQKKVLVLLDGSASMDRVELDISRRARLDSLLSTEAFSQLGSEVDMTSYWFGGNITDNRQDVDRSKTSLGDVIYEMDKRQLTDPANYWLLLSDGNSNSGREVREASQGLPLPVITVDMSAGIGDFDVALTNIEFSPVVFVGEQTEVKIKLSWHRALNKSMQVQLLDSNRVLDQQVFNITQDAGLGEIVLKYQPPEPGQRILRVNIPALEDEENDGNNQRSFAVKILKSKLLVLLATDSPDYEVGFLKRFLDRSDRYEVDLRVTGDKAGNLAGVFPTRQGELNRFDLVILYDPDPAVLQSRRGVIESYLSEKGGALWLLMGRRFVSRGPVDWFNRLLPFYQSQPRPVSHRDFHAVPAEGNLFHPAVRLADDQTSIRNAWAELPPFQSLVICDQIDRDGVVLAYRSEGSAVGLKTPVIGFKRLGPGKVFAQSVLPLWTWGFVNLGFGEDDSRYGKFIEGVASWLTVKEDFDPIRVAPDKQVYSRGETIRFDGYAYDQGFRPIADVVGRVKLIRESDQESMETDLVALGDGKFYAEYYNLTPDRYRYSAMMEKDGRLLKQNDGKLLIESFSLEQYDQSGDPATLTALSRLSGGSYYTFRQFDDALAAIDRTPETLLVRSEVVVWNKLWILLTIIGALSIEWLLRKANQLI